MRVSSCRCVAQESDIAVAKVIDNRYSERLVCIYHRDEAEHMNNMAHRKVGIYNETTRIVNLDNNVIYLKDV